ncbi:MAG TPA: hypothetical protein VGN16_11310 [Acidobacteriaceae bacterium]|jgi:hypothetical protein
MEFENLQAIWDTQLDKPVFRMNEAGLMVSLYRHRERSRRDVFWKLYVPACAALLIMLLILTGTCLLFYFKDASHDFPMTVWDGVAFFVGVAALGGVAAPLCLVRSRHERRQEVFAPTIREEIDLSIEQLEFEIEVAGHWVIRNPLLLTIGVTLVMWEMARLNGNRAPSWDGFLAVALMPFVSWITRVAVKAGIEKVTLPRKRELEQLRASLEGSSGRD